MNVQPCCVLVMEVEFLLAHTSRMLPIKSLLVCCISRENFQIHRNENNIGNTHVPTMQNLKINK